MELKALEMLKDWNNGDYPSKQKIDEAIEELEALQNRKCIDCKFFTKDGVFYGIYAKDVNTTKNQDLWLSNIEFLCNRFEPKEDCK